METSVQSPSAADSAQYQHLNSNCIQAAVFDKFPFKTNRKSHQFQNFSLEFQNAQTISEEILQKNEFPDLKLNSNSLYDLKCEKWDQIFRNSDSSYSAEVNMSAPKEFPEFQIDMQIILNEIFDMDSTSYENAESSDRSKKVMASNESYDWNSNSNTNSDLLSSTSSSLSPRNSNFNRLRPSLAENLELYKILNDNLRMGVDEACEANMDESEKFSMNLQNPILHKKKFKLHKNNSNNKDGINKNSNVAAKATESGSVTCLNKSDTGSYSYCPEIDTLSVVVCSICDKCIKPQALERHLINRHQLNNSMSKNLEKFDSKLTAESNHFKPNSQKENEIVEDVTRKVQISGESRSKLEKPSITPEKAKEEADDIIISTLNPESNYLSTSAISKSAVENKLLQENAKSNSSFSNQPTNEMNLIEIQPVDEFTSNTLTSNSLKFEEDNKIKELITDNETNAVADPISSNNNNNLKSNIENLPLGSSSPNSVTHYLNNNNRKSFQFATPNDPKLPITPKQRKILPIKQRFYDPNKHCGVLTSDLNLSETDRTLKPCTRSLTCKSHALSLRRSVMGRAKSFDNLLNEHRTNKEKIIEEKSTSKNLTGKRKPSATDLFTSSNLSLNTVENFTLESSGNIESLKTPSNSSSISNSNSKHILKLKPDKSKLSPSLKKFKLATQSQDSSDSNNNSNLPNLDMILQKDDIQGNSDKYKRLKDYMLLKVSQNRNNAKMQLQRKFSTKSKFNSKQNKAVDHNYNKANTISNLIGFLSNTRENVIIDGGTQFKSNPEIIVNYNSDENKSVRTPNANQNEFELHKLEKLKFVQNNYDKINSQLYDFNADEDEKKLQDCVNLQEIEPAKYEIEKISTKPIQTQHLENYSQLNYAPMANKYTSNQNHVAKIFNGSSQISNPHLNNCYTTTQIIANDSDPINPNYQYLITLQNHLQFQNSSYSPDSDNPDPLRHQPITSHNSDAVQSSIVIDQQEQVPQINNYAYVTPNSTNAEKLENRKVNLTTEFDFQSKQNKNLITELGLMDFDIIQNSNLNRNSNATNSQQHPGAAYCDSIKFSDFEMENKFEFDEGVRLITYNSNPKPIKMNDFNLMKMKNSPYSILFRKSALQLRKLNLAMLNGINLSHCTNSQQPISISKRLQNNSTQHSSAAQNLSQQQFLVQHLQQQKRQQSFQTTDQAVATKLLQGIANNNISKQMRQQKTHLNLAQNSIKNVPNNLSRYTTAQPQPQNQNKLTKRSPIMNKILLKEYITCSKNSKLSSSSKFHNKKFDKNRIKINSKLLIYLKANCEATNIEHNSELYDNPDYQMFDKQHSDIDVNFESNMNLNRISEPHIKQEAVEMLPNTKRKYCNNNSLVKNGGLKLNCNSILNNIIDFSVNGTKIAMPLESNDVQQQTQLQQQRYHATNNSNLSSINFIANLNRQSLLNITNSQRQQQQQQIPQSQHPQA